MLEQRLLKMQKPLTAHPKKFILDIIRVPPNTIRPDIRRIGGSRSNNNDITALTKNIVEINEVGTLTTGTWNATTIAVANCSRSCISIN
jgi:DNA-directed RNA polymerase beta' subunit